jgi:hypothetical protein
MCSCNDVFFSSILKIGLNISFKKKFLPEQCFLQVKTKLASNFSVGCPLKCDDSSNSAHKSLPIFTFATSLAVVSEITIGVLSVINAYQNN